MPAVAMLHSADPKQILTEKIGDVSGIDVFHNQVLCAVYFAPEKTAGGIIRPDMNKDEDRHQSKVALILKVGPRAFQADKDWSWPEDIGAGDWVFLRRSTGWNVTVNAGRDNLCVMVDDTDIRGRIAQPDMVW